MGEQTFRNQNIGKQNLVEQHLGEWAFRIQNMGNPVRQEPQNQPKDNK